MKTAWINKPNWYQPELRTKTNYGGRVIENKIISKKTNLLITGSHHSGKTRAITRLHENAQNIWSAQIRPYAFTKNTQLATKASVTYVGDRLDLREHALNVFTNVASLHKFARTRQIT